MWQLSGEPPGLQSSTVQQTLLCMATQLPTHQTEHNGAVARTPPPDRGTEGKVHAVRERVSALLTHRR